MGGGTLKGFNTGDGERNHLQVVVIRDRGWLFVNGEFVSALDLSSATGPGDIAVMTGAYTCDEVSGAVTRYENFRGSRLTEEYGPANGRLRAEPGVIGENYSGVRTRDLVAEATFINPQDPTWDYGFLIRYPDYDRFEVIGLYYDGWWFHQTRSSGDDGYTPVASGWMSDAGVSFQDRNRLLLLAFGDSGWFFVNGQLVTKLDLSHNMDYGSVSAMGSFYMGNEGSPRFENFSVWTP